MQVSTFLRSKIWTIVILCASAAVPMLRAGTEYPLKPGEQVVPNQLLLKLKSGALPSAVIPAFLPNAQFQALGLLNTYIVNAPGGIPPGISALLAAHSLVDFVEPNRVRKTTLVTPNDPNYSNALQWALFTVQAFQAWSQMPSLYLTSATAGTSRLKVA